MYTGYLIYYVIVNRVFIVFIGFVTEQYQISKRFKIINNNIRSTFFYTFYLINLNTFREGTHDSRLKTYLVAL